MKTASIVLVGLLITIIEGTSLAGGLPTADVNLVVAIHLGLTRTPVAGSIAAFISGFLTDLATGCPKGLATGQATIVFFLTYSLTSRFLVRGWATEIPFALVLSLIASLWASLVLTWLPARSVFPAPPVASVLVHAAATAVASPFVFGMMRGIDGLFERRRQGLLR